MNYQIIIRLSLLFIIVLLGLTVVFPQWLDLVSMMSQEYRVQDQGVLYNGNPDKGFKYLWLINFPDNLISFVHQTIIDPLYDKPVGGIILFNLIAVFIWSALVILLYLIFIALTTLLHATVYLQTAPHIKRYLMTDKFPIALHGVIAGLSITTIFFAWPFIIGSIAAIFKAIFYLFIMIAKH